MTFPSENSYHVRDISFWSTIVVFVNVEPHGVAPLLCNYTYLHSDIVLDGRKHVFSHHLLLFLSHLIVNLHATSNEYVYSTYLKRSHCFCRIFLIVHLPPPNAFSNKDNLWILNSCLCKSRRVANVSCVPVGLYKGRKYKLQMYRYHRVITFAVFRFPIFIPLSPASAWSSSPSASLRVQIWFFLWYSMVDGYNIENVLFSSNPLPNGFVWYLTYHRLSSCFFSISPFQWLSYSLVFLLRSVCYYASQDTVADQQ